ncbi:MAG TPA: hypothetical protein VGH34_06015 [Vicinamibacterales bacterium]|jgi:hypothetical protein
MNSENIGRAVGVASGLGCVFLSVVVIMTEPIFKDGAGLLPFIIPFFGMSGLLAAVASVYRSRLALLALFVFSFLPFGAYLMLVPSQMHWFGVLQFGYLVSLALLRAGRKIGS